MGKKELGNNNLLMRLNKRIGSRNVITAIAATVFVIIFLIGNYICNVISATLSNNYNNLFGAVQLVRLRAFKHPFTTFLFFLLLIIDIIYVVVLSYRIYTSYTDMNIGQKGSERFSTVEEIQQQYIAVPDKEIEFEGINAEDVTFAYGEETILDNFSIDIKKGEITGIIGKSGSGKSTLLKLFMRFWDTDKGRISISGSDIKNINTSNLRDMEGFMTQDTHLFHDSIKNNIRIAKLDATDEEIVNACKKASIHDFIQSLPQGYDTPVGELGDTLSGGEKQRIGLARVFLHNAPLILLDEPTSNLDSLNEAVILKSLNEERQNKTVVMVSHRQSTMRITDKIYSVENGRMS